MATGYLPRDSKTNSRGRITVTIPRFLLRDKHKKVKYHAIRRDLVTYGIPHLLGLGVG